METVHRRLLAALAALLLFLPSTQASAASNEFGVAVIIGNKAYQDDRVPDVDYAHNDADAFYKFVVGTLGFSPDNVVDLRDATKARMESAFGAKGNVRGQLWRWAEADGSSDIVVFYSGHGVPGISDGRGYLLPVDANPDTAEINGYPIDVLYENLGKVPSKSVTVFLDACFSGASGDGGKLIEGASPVYVEADVSGVAGLTVLTAASGKQLASWDTKARHGLFTEHLLDALYGAADADNDGGVSAAEAKLYLDRHMTRAARRTYGREQDAGLHGDESAVLSYSLDGWVSRPLLGPPPAAFTVLVEPVDARVRILNIAPRYRAGMELVAGPYEVEASAPSYVTKTVTVTHGATPTIHRMALSRLGQPFTIVPTPTHARVRLLDNVEAYRAGMRLPAGSYLVEASADGYETATETVAHGAAPTLRQIALAEERQVGSQFRDCPDCPELVVLPSCRCAMGAYEVTFAEWDACADDGGCGSNKPNDNGWGRDRHPVINISWVDVQRYVGWLSEKTEKRYRLPTQSEWEFAARAGSTTKYYFGDSPTQLCRYANHADQITSIGARNNQCSDGVGERTASVGTYLPNSFGLYDMHGNVWEWTQDCWAPSSPNDAYAANNSAPEDCARRILRGGSWFDGPKLLQSTSRTRADARRNFHGFAGFRVFREL